MLLHELLLTPFAFSPPSHVLDDLSGSDAARRVVDAPHTIAELVAHLAFWQAWFLKRCRGVAEPMAEHAAIGWPVATAESWAGIRERFVEGLHEAVALGSDTDRASEALAPAIDFPPLAHYTVHDALVHVAMHNAHHLGQIILLRQMLGRWPPPAGSWTW